MPRKNVKDKKEASAKQPAAKGPVADRKERDAFIASLKKSGMLGDTKRKINRVSTGSWVINRLIGDGTHKGQPGGIPRGFVTEIYGDEATGKTTMALHIAKQAMLADEIVVYADFEQSLRAQHLYLENLGIDTNHPNFVHLVPNSFEDGVKVIGECLFKLRPSVIIIDSVTAMLPKETVENDAGDPIAIGRHARLVGSFINWVIRKLQIYDCGLVLVNQMRSNIKGQYEEGPKTITTGGKAIPFFASLRIRLKKTQNREKISTQSSITGIKEDKIISQEVKVIIEKNKLDMPYKSGPIYIVFGQGIDNIMSLISLGINKKIIKSGGAGYFSWKDPNSSLEFNVQGKQGLKKYLEQNPAVLKALQPHLLPTQDEQEIDNIQEELETIGVENMTADQKEQLREIRKLKGLPVDDLTFSAEEMDSLAELDAITSESIKAPQSEDEDFQ
jgi:recombination protein RecA